MYSHNSAYSCCNPRTGNLHICPRWLVPDWMVQQDSESNWLDCQRPSFSRNLFLTSFSLQSNLSANYNNHISGNSCDNEEYNFNIEADATFSHQLNSNCTNNNNYSYELDNLVNGNNNDCILVFDQHLTNNRIENVDVEIIDNFNQRYNHSSYQDESTLATWDYMNGNDFNVQEQTGYNEFASPGYITDYEENSMDDGYDEEEEEENEAGEALEETPTDSPWVPMGDGRFMHRITGQMAANEYGMDILTREKPGHQTALILLQRHCGSPSRRKKKHEDFPKKPPSSLRYEIKPDY